MGNGDFRIRLGDNTELGKLKHAPPDNEYRTIHEWIVEHAPGSNVNNHKTKSDEIVAMITGSENGNDEGNNGGGERKDNNNGLSPSPLLRVASRVPVQNQWSNLKRVQLRANSGAFQVELQDDGCVQSTGVDTISYPSVVADAVHLTDGKWYYEVTVLNAPSRGTGARCSIGWSDKQFVGVWNQGKGVGDDQHSFGVFSIDENDQVGSRHNNVLNSSNYDTRKFNKQLKTIRDKQLKRGDVLSFLLDLDTCVMRFGVNGEWLPNVIFQQFAFVGGLTPAVSLGGTFEVHSSLVISSCAPKSFLIVLINFLLVFSFFSSSLLVIFLFQGHKQEKDNTRSIMNCNSILVKDLLTFNKHRPVTAPSINGCWRNKHVCMC